jgi:hypothetical protein
VGGGGEEIEGNIGVNIIKIHYKHVWKFNNETHYFLVAHTCNLIYFGDWDQDDHGSRLTQANTLQDSVSKITRAKWTGGVSQAVECPLYKCKTLSSNLNPTKEPHYFVQLMYANEKILLW